MRIKKITLVAVLVSIGLVLGILEAKIPFMTIIPGGKIGLSNICVLLSVYLLTPAHSLLISVLKGLLVSVLTGNISAFLYSGTGGAVSVLSMVLAKKVLKKKTSCVGVSIIGAMAFNLSQVIVFTLVANNINMLRYLPVLWFISAFSGLVTGIISNGILGVVKNV